MTREEAIKVASEMHGWLQTDREREALETLIPELAESEDERMMREFNDWLYEEIECRTNDLRDEKDRRTLNMLCYILTKVKDWLEKQKEQKPADYETELKKCKDNPLYFYDKYVSIKQKPAKWSEDDENCIRNLESVIYYDKYLPTDTRIKLGDFLKSLRPSWKPSEDDFESLLRLKGSMPDNEWGNQMEGFIEDLIDNLKKL